MQCLFYFDKYLNYLKFFKTKDCASVLKGVRTNNIVKALVILEY